MFDRRKKEKKNHLTPKSEHTIQEVKKIGNHILDSEKEKYRQLKSEDAGRESQLALASLIERCLEEFLREVEIIEKKSPSSQMENLFYELMVTEGVLEQILSSISLSFEPFHFLSSYKTFMTNHGREIHDPKMYNLCLTYLTTYYKQQKIAHKIFKNDLPFISLSDLFQDQKYVDRIKEMVKREEKLSEIIHHPNFLSFARELREVCYQEHQFFLLLTEYLEEVRWNGKVNFIFQEELFKRARNQNGQFLFDEKMLEQLIQLLISNQEYPGDFEQVSAEMMKEFRQQVQSICMEGRDTLSEIEQLIQSKWPAVEKIASFIPYLERTKIQSDPSLLDSNNVTNYLKYLWENKNIPVYIMIDQEESSEVYCFNQLLSRCAKELELPFGIREAEIQGRLWFPKNDDVMKEFYYYGGMMLFIVNHPLEKLEFELKYWQLEILRKMSPDYHSIFLLSKDKIGYKSDRIFKMCNYIQYYYYENIASFLEEARQNKYEERSDQYVFKKKSK